MQQIQQLAATNTTAVEITEPIVGSVYEFQGDVVEIRAVDGTEAEVLRAFTGRTLTVPISTLQPIRHDRSVRNFQDVDQAAWDEAKRRAAILNQILDNNITRRRDLDRLGASVRLKHSSLQKLLKRYRHNRLVSTCLNRRPGPIPGATRNAPRRDIILKAIDRCVSKAEATTVGEIVREANRLQGPGKLNLITTNAVRKSLARTGYSLKERKRKGPEKWREGQLVLPGKHEVSGPLEEVQIDHTQIDLMVLDDTRRYVLGRPWLTLVIDVYSRMILGFYLSLRSPSMVSVARAVSIAVQPKNDLLAALGLAALQWSGSGIPRVVKTDNASEFTSDQFVRACEQWGIDPQLRPLGRKHWGGHIERAVGRVMGDLHLLPGTTFRNVVVRAKYNSAAQAVMTHDAVVRYLVAQICKYNSEPRRVLNNWSSEIVWAEAWKGRDDERNATRALDMKNFYISFLPAVNPKLQPDGVHWSTHRYWHPCLRAYEIGKPVQVRVDHHDTRRVFVQTRSGGDYMAVPRIDSALSDNHSFDEALRRARTLRSEEEDNQGNLEFAGTAGQLIVAEEVRETARVARKAARTPVVIEARAKPIRQAPPPDPGEGAYVPATQRAIVQRLP